MPYYVEMRVDLPIADTWYEANEQARKHLGVADDPNISVQVYLGARHALWEVTQSLARTFSHRRTIGYTPFTGPEGEFVALEFAKEGYTVKGLTQEEFDQPKSWLESAGKQMLCVLSSYDDPATGELYQSESHLSAMKDQRIFRVMISHAYHENFEIGKVGPYEVQIISLRPDLAIAVLGERAKMNPAVPSNLVWKDLLLVNFNKKSSSDIEAQKKALTEFAKALPKEFTFYTSAKQTLNDRAVLLVPDVEGLSFISELAKTLNVQVRNPGENSSLETLSLCRWQDPRQLEWLASKGLSVDKLRGSVIISAELIQKLGFGEVINALTSSLKQIRLEQQ